MVSQAPNGGRPWLSYTKLLNALQSFPVRISQASPNDQYVATPSNRSSTGMSQSPSPSKTASTAQCRSHAESPSERSLWVSLTPPASPRPGSSVPSSGTHHGLYSTLSANRAYTWSTCGGNLIAARAGTSFRAPSCSTATWKFFRRVSVLLSGSCGMNPLCSSLPLDLFYDIYTITTAVNDKSFMYGGLTAFVSCFFRPTLSR